MYAFQFFPTPKSTCSLSLLQAEKKPLGGSLLLPYYKSGAQRNGKNWTKTKTIVLFLFCFVLSAIAVGGRLCMTGLISCVPSEPTSQPLSCDFFFLDFLDFLLPR